MAIDTRVRQWLAFIIPTGVIIIVSAGLESLLIAGGVSPMVILGGSNVMAGAMCGTLYVRGRIQATERQRELEERLRKIADMNHHVRNALAVVQFYGAQRGDLYATEAVAQAVRRIEWTLREVLPRGWNLKKTEVAGIGEKSKAASASQFN